MIPSHLSRVLHAVSAADASALAGKLRTTLQLSFYVGVLSCLFFLLTAHPLLSLFGEGYADQASSTLRVLALGIFANTIKSHYMTIARVEGRITVAAVGDGGGRSAGDCGGGGRGDGGRTYGPKHRPHGGVLR